MPATSSDGRLIATGQPDGAVSIVDARTLAPQATFPVVDTGAARSVGFVPGSHLLVVGGDGDDGFLALLDADSGRVVRRLAGHRGAINQPGISADGSLLSTSDRNGGVRFWSLPEGAARGSLSFAGEIFTSQLSPDGRHLMVVRFDSRSERSTVEVWDVSSRSRVRTLPFDELVIARISPDGRLLAVGTRTGRSQVWSTETWKPVTRFLAGDGGGIVSAVISRDGSTLVTAGTTGTVRMWDIGTQQAVGSPLPGVPSGEAAALFTSDGARLIAAYANGRAFLWDLRPERLLRQACQVAARRLTTAEWAEFLPGHDYHPAC